MYCTKAQIMPEDNFNESKEKESRDGAVAEKPKYGSPTEMGLNELEWLSLSDWTAEGAKNFPHSRKSLATLAENSSEGLSAPTVDVTPRIKFERVDKTARHIMPILDTEAGEHVRAQMEIPDIKPGYTGRLKVEVPESKRRVSTIVGTVIARRNAGLSTEDFALGKLRMTHESSSDPDPDDSDAGFVEIDPTGRYGRYKEVLGRGAFKKVYPFLFVQLCHFSKETTFA
ncbi:hypothetical protein SADUNF_Sadunf15G0074000 [Salix dunnii]|uniref:Uncharacterized protein n=1 Tax=Salix dunnii TaxID=1413687 RepID=A0A835MIN0_9ROSI|nr:hypothetical protein SADUNF_Sadunf15G0074000 [Salix dunnii]